MKYSSADKQVREAAKHISAHGIDRDQTRHSPYATSSVRTEENFKGSMKSLVEHMKEHKLGGIWDVDKNIAKDWLDQRAGEVSQETLDFDRQQINKWLEYKDGQSIDKIQSQKEEDGNKLKDISRYYTSEQIEKIKEAQTEKHSCATQVAHEGGLRASELHTIAKKEEQPASERDYRDDLNDYKGQEQVEYTVIGKGGLVREITLSKATSERLEQKRLEEPQTVKDRGVNYTSRYNIGGGKNWSASFTRASQRQLNWSKGAHGTRHSYAQNRLVELQQNGYTEEDGKEIVSQEVGHFRIEQTEEYLRK